MFTTVLILIICVLVHKVSVQEREFWKQCDKKGIHFYEELGCEVIRNNSAICPIAFKCPAYIVPIGKCVFHGQELNDGEEPDAGYCNQGCVCRADSMSKGGFDCNQKIYCDEVPIGTPQISRYGKEYYDSDLQTECKEEKQIYRAGNAFTPRGTCWDCICQKDFSGKYEAPFCVRRPCDMELGQSIQLEKQCAPLYASISEHEGLCCPVRFICPENVIEITPILNGEDSDLQCKFGDESYMIGDKIAILYKERENKKEATCDCYVPPYVACVVLT